MCTHWRMVQDTLSPLGRQLEMCLARQVQLQAAKRHGPLGAFTLTGPACASEEAKAQPNLLGDAGSALLAAARNAGRLGIGGGIPSVPWPHPAQNSLDSAITRSNLSAAALERADQFKVCPLTLMYAPGRGWLAWRECMGVGLKGYLFV